MRSGRKNLMRAVGEHNLALQDGESIMKVVSLRGSNIFEVMDADGQNSLALLPSKFQKSMWVKLGNFVVVDESGKEKALKSGCKVACIIIQVLFHEQVRRLQKSPEWPEIFKSTDSEGSDRNPDKNNPQEEVDELGSSDDDDDLPPLEANMNRIKPPQWQSDAESDTESDSL